MQHFLESQSAGLENRASVKGCEVFDGGNACHDATFSERVGGGGRCLQVAEDGVAASARKETVHAILDGCCLPSFVGGVLRHTAPPSLRVEVLILRIARAPSLGGTLAEGPSFGQSVPAREVVAAPRFRIRHS